MVIFHSYVSLPEGNPLNLSQPFRRQETSRWAAPKAVETLPPEVASNGWHVLIETSLLSMYKKEWLYAWTIVNIHDIYIYTYIHTSMYTCIYVKKYVYIYTHIFHIFIHINMPYELLWYVVHQWRILHAIKTHQKWHITRIWWNDANGGSSELTMTIPLH